MRNKIKNTIEKFHKNIIPIKVPQKENQVIKIVTQDKRWGYLLMIAYVVSPRALRVVNNYGNIQHHEPITYLIPYLIRKDLFKVTIQIQNK